MSQTLQVFSGHHAETLLCSLAVCVPCFFTLFPLISLDLPLLLSSLFFSPSLWLIASLSFTFLSLLLLLSTSVVAISDVKVLSELRCSSGKAKYITVQCDKESSGDAVTGGFNTFTALTQNHAPELFYNLTTCQSFQH